MGAKVTQSASLLDDEEPTTVGCPKCKWKQTCPGPIRAWASWVKHNSEKHARKRYAIEFKGSNQRQRRTR